MTSREEVFDVVVVGGGGSGLAAAIEARACGATVLLLEKNPNLGGSTAWSVGSITSTGTPHQLRAGIRDDPQGHYEDMPAFAGVLLRGRRLPHSRAALPEGHRAWLVLMCFVKHVSACPLD